MIRLISKSEKFSCYFCTLLGPDWAHILLRSSFKLSSLNMYQAWILVDYIFRILARAIQVFQVFSNSSLAEFEFWGLNLVEYQVLGSTIKHYYLQVPKLLRLNFHYLELHSKSLKWKRILRISIKETSIEIVYAVKYVISKLFLLLSIYF